MENKQTLPNAAAVLVLGICSIVFCCAFVGLVLGIIGLALSVKGRAMYKQNPGLYEGYGMLNAGFITSIIGTVLGGIYSMCFIFFIIFKIKYGNPYHWHHYDETFIRLFSFGSYCNL